MTTAYNPPKIVHTEPVWKTIGESSASFDANGLWFERVDGIRVPVRRHFGMSPNDDNPFRTQEDLLDMENQIQRNLLREAYRMNDARMGDRAYSEELRMRERRLEDEEDLCRWLKKRTFKDFSTVCWEYTSLPNKQSA